MLYRAELHPAVTARRTYRVTVRAHEFALRELFEHQCTCPAPEQSADGIDLLVTRQVVPVHHGGGERLPAVRARSITFELRHPIQRGCATRTLSSGTRAPAALAVITAIVLTTTITTVGELARPRRVELEFRLPLPAPSAPAVYVKPRFLWIRRRKTIFPHAAPSPLDEECAVRGNSRIRARTSRAPRGPPRASRVSSH